VGTSLDITIQPQPNDTTCGPTCLQAVYGYFGDPAVLEEVVGEVRHLEEGGTLAVLLGLHALRRGYDARIYTFNVQVFDPTWFAAHAPDLKASLLAQYQAKEERKLRLSCNSYVQFLERGGEVRFEDLTPALLSRYLETGVPLLTGLSATYLYRCARETEPDGRYDDVRGVPQGHFVVLCGYDPVKRSVLVADPQLPNPVSPFHKYEVGIDRLIGAILLGILTYDSVLLVVRPKDWTARAVDADRRRRQQPG
jgi:hypothetical protein